MPRGVNQKLKLSYLIRILLEQTDDEHSLSVTQIIQQLAVYGIKAERKSIYDDLEALRQLGYDVITESQGRRFTYYIGSRDFELPELKLLVDAVQSSRFITKKKSTTLIRKLEGLASKYQAKTLQRQVLVQDRIKTMNESVFYSIDKIYQGISDNVRIRFQYFQWNTKKEMELRHNGRFYEVSPWRLVWNNQNYYLVGYDDDSQTIKHFRVDKMIKIQLTEHQRTGKKVYLQSARGEYEQGLFGMFSGETQWVTLVCNNYLAGVIIDRFGKDVMIHTMDAKQFKVRVSVSVSEQFFGWLAGLGDGIRIVEPKEVQEAYHRHLLKCLHMYQ